MAESKVVFEVQVTAKGMKQLQKQLKDTNKETKKTAENTDKATKSTDKFDKQNKSLYQSNLSSAKGFSNESNHRFRWFFRVSRCIRNTCC